MRPSYANQPRLAAHEVLTVLVVLGLIVTLCAISLANYNPPEPEIVRPGAGNPPPLLSIQVDGAVASPGSYVLPKGSCLSDLIQQLTLLPNANLEAINPKSRFYRSKKIWIPYKGQVAVTLKGAVKSPGRYLFPENTRVRDLAACDLLAHNADVRALKRRRAKLRDNQTLEIPFA